MISNKQWIKLSMISSLVGATLLASFNAIVDPLNIIHSPFFSINPLSNERFLKIEYLEKHHKEFNSYMIGSSRIGTTPPSEIEPYLPHSKIYNLTLQAATLYDYLVHIRYMTEENYPIDTLYMQLDVDTMNYYGTHSSDYLYRPHPYVEAASLPLFYMQYLFGIYPFSTQEKIMQNLHPTLQVENILSTGVWKNSTAEKALTKNCQAYIQNISDFQTTYQRLLQYSTKKETLKALKEIVEIAKKHHIKLYTFITPHNHKMMDTFLLNDYLEYLSDIVDITEVYNFSGYNSITNNDCNYYEISHYRPHVGKLIAARIFKNQNIKVPEDFGVLLNKDNIQRYLKKYKEEIEEHDKKEP